jgi:transposase
MDRYALTDAQWAKMEPHCRGKKSDPGRSAADNRRFVGAVLWIARTGSPWRDLPAEFGNWNTVFKRFRAHIPRAVLTVKRRISDNPGTRFRHLRRNLRVDVSTAVRHYRLGFRQTRLSFAHLEILGQSTSSMPALAGLLSE